MEKIHYALYMQCREARAGGQPDSLVIDSQSVKSAEKATVLTVKGRFAFR